MPGSNCRLIGSVWTGHVRNGSDIDIHIFSDSLGPGAAVRSMRGLTYDVERKRMIKYNEERTFTHIHVADASRFELTLYPEDKVHYIFKSSITGKAIERRSIVELEESAPWEDPKELQPRRAEVERLEDAIDRFDPLPDAAASPSREWLKQSPRPPRGDALYHSLPVFELARDERPYDEGAARRPAQQRGQGDRPVRPRRSAVQGARRVGRSGPTG